MSQNATVLAYLKTGRKLTPIGALVDFGIYRLAARVNQLRNEGHPITTAWVQRKNKRYASYTLEAK